MEYNGIIKLQVVEVKEKFLIEGFTN